MNEFGKIISLAKVFAMAMGDRTITISDEEQDAAFEGLKTMADNSNNWTKEEKEYYKMMVDFGNMVTRRKEK
jgi:hypothetical protein